MSDVMLFGVLGMPYEMAMRDDLARMQFYDRAQQAAQELRIARAALEWQPIETAPKDGTRVLTYREGFRESMAVAWFNATGCGEPCWVPVNGSAWPDPTHWMPLPPPPNKER